MGFLTADQISSIQADLLSTSYNWTVDVKRHNISANTFKTVVSGLPCVLEQEEPYVLGEDRNTVENRPVTAFLYCQPNPLLNDRGLVITPVTINGVAVVGPQAEEYKVMVVDDPDGLGIEWRLKLALVA